MSLLIRAGFDKEKLNIRNGSVTLEYNGRMDVDSGHDTKFVVTTTNLKTGTDTIYSYSTPLEVQVL